MREEKGGDGILQAMLHIVMLGMQYLSVYCSLATLYVHVHYIMCQYPVIKLSTCCSTIELKEIMQKCTK